MATGPIPKKTGLNYRQAFKDTDGFSKIIRVNQPFIIDLKTFERLILQNIPNELNYDPNSTFVSLESPGRNNPLYHYTGSEDTLSFTLTWYADESNRQDVITKCKWIESLSKNDGFDNRPSPIKFIWGDLFKQSTFIVAHAPYKMKNFNREFGLLPTGATQELTLKRITSQSLSKVNIQKYDY